eukprot:CAMPEP_0177221464 /NCGR_PEP_ID=MMETSP0367-20130122/37429_1 /TAXON_ID=447022 ORGANISM="Scrippsiella hangoei-like, Strain SHHI-4" /NCGR_SAMPLE_ID=MMETSP0367 /ASSEMBLY_ACC=CAM_ASM_000362 /LENGTH=527 /DNA_ID=CAMNT_0018671297 /DNA_START=11 /DNA_END=1594 /DNA_ORIENTATION=+
MLDGAGARPETEAQVRLAIWQRKLAKQGHDAVKLYCCTSRVGDRTSEQRIVCAAAFRVFRPYLVPAPAFPPLLEIVGIQVGMVVVDVVVHDDGGRPIRARICYRCTGRDATTTETMLRALCNPGPLDCFETVYVFGTVGETRTDSCNSLASSVESMMLRACASSGTAHDMSCQNLFAILLNVDRGTGENEIAWLARSFDLGNAGNPLAGNCSSFVFRAAVHDRDQDDTPMVGMYSCVTAKAPTRCHSGEPAAIRSSEDFAGFVMLHSADTLMQLVARYLEAPSENNGVPTAREDVFAFRSEVSESCKVQRLSDCMNLVDTIEVDPQEVRFTQNTISSKFRDGRDVRSLVSELASSPELAASLPQIQIFRQGGVLHSLDNRRLYALKVAGVRRVMAQEVQVRRDVQLRKQTSTCFGQFIVFGDDPSIAHVNDIIVDLSECIGDQPDCSHYVEQTVWGSSAPSRSLLKASDLVKSLAKNGFPISDHFRPVFDSVMRSFTVPPEQVADDANRKGNRKGKRAKPKKPARVD